MEKIESIEKYTIDESKCCESESGYIISTESRTITISAESGAINGSCCEDFGDITTDDDINEFIGCDLLSIFTSNTIESEKVNDDRYLYSAFIVFNTNNGPLQFTVYNTHNGYYGHRVQFRFEYIV